MNYITFSFNSVTIPYKDETIFKGNYLLFKRTLMKPFNEIIYLDNEALSFHFHLIHTVFGQKFFITVNKDRRAFVFDMKMDNHGKWEIVGSAPQWVQQFEEKLRYIITQNI